MMKTQFSALMIALLSVGMVACNDDQKNEVKAIGGDLVIESIRSWELEKTMK